MIEIVSYFPAFLSDRRWLIFSLKDLLFIYLFTCTVIYVSGFQLIVLSEIDILYILLSFGMYSLYSAKTTLSLQNVSKWVWKEEK